MRTAPTEPRQNKKLVTDFSLLPTKRRTATGSMCSHLRISEVRDFNETLTAPQRGQMTHVAELNLNLGKAASRTGTRPHAWQMRRPAQARVLSFRFEAQGNVMI